MPAFEIRFENDCDLFLDLVSSAIAEGGLEAVFEPCLLQKRLRLVDIISVFEELGVVAGIDLGDRAFGFTRRTEIDALGDLVAGHEIV